MYAERKDYPDNDSLIYIVAMCCNLSIGMLAFTVTAATPFFPPVRVKYMKLQLLSLRLQALKVYYLCDLNFTG